MGACHARLRLRSRRDAVLLVVVCLAAVLVLAVFFFQAARDSGHGGRLAAKEDSAGWTWLFSTPFVPGPLNGTGKTSSESNSATARQSSNPSTPSATPSLVQYMGYDGKALPIRPETFLYLSMGPEMPTLFTYQRSCFPRSALIFLSFRKPIWLGTLPNCNCTTIHFPNSTWTTGRNQLLLRAIGQEAHYGWRYEFFVFTDNDISLVSFNPAENGEQLFRNLLVRDRPIRASVRYGPVPLPPVNAALPKCARACYTDACVDAYHRTGVELVLPWSPAFDQVSWFMSAYIVNLLLAALAPGHCHIYRQLTADSRHLTSTKYPRGANRGIEGGSEWADTRAYVNWWLAQRKVPGYPTRPDDLVLKIQDGLFGSVLNGTEKGCVAAPRNVDYSKIVKYRIY